MGRSPYGPKRFGVEHENIEMERRLNRIEEELHRVRGLPNAQFRTASTTRRLATDFGRSRLAPPQVVNLSVDNTVVGAITVKWDPVRSPDLRRYRVDYDTAISFNSSSFKTAFVPSDTVFNIQEGDTDTRYYVRVRAETDQSAGPWSSILDTTTGNVTTSKIADGAVTGILTDQVTSFTPSSLTVNSNGETQSATYDLSSFTIINDLVFVIATVQFSYSLEPGDIVTVEIRQDGSPLTGAQYITEYNVTTNTGATVTKTDGQLTVPGFSVMTTTTAGSHDYSVFVELDDDDNDAGTRPSTLTPTQIDFTIWEPIR